MGYVWGEKYYHYFCIYLHYIWKQYHLNLHTYEIVFTLSPVGKVTQERQQAIWEV